MTEKRSSIEAGAESREIGRVLKRQIIAMIVPALLIVPPAAALLFHGLKGREPDSRGQDSISTANSTLNQSGEHVANATSNPTKIEEPKRGEADGRGSEPRTPPILAISDIPPPPPQPDAAVSDARTSDARVDRSSANSSAAKPSENSPPPPPQPDGALANERRTTGNDQTTNTPATTDTPATTPSRSTPRSRANAKAKIVHVLPRTNVSNGGTVAYAKPETSAADSSARRGVAANPADALLPSAPARTTKGAAEGSDPKAIQHVIKPAPAFTLPSFSPSARRVLVQDRRGREFVTRVLGEWDGKTTLLLPDGRLGWPERRRLLYTDLPFVPDSPAKIRDDLLAGDYANFHHLTTTHYVIIYDCSRKFAENSARLLESLYTGLARALTKSGIDAHEAEVPLVAIIYDTEKRFRARSDVAPQVQAYYEIATNHIYFYEHSDTDQSSPEVAAMRKPQTVAHEGTHQILQNIGVQPRMAPWPLWIVEGLAEYCAPTTTKKGSLWAGVGKVNPLHMATIRDVEDQLALQETRSGDSTPVIGRDRKISLAEYLVTRTELSPTDYALAWGFTHFLINRRQAEFIRYLKSLSALEPLQERTTREQLIAFREVFGLDLHRLDRESMKYLAGLQFEELPYYAVLFEQPLPRGLVRRGFLVSQSSQMIRQWIEGMTVADGGPPSWRMIPHPTKTRATLTARRWINNQ